MKTTQITVENISSILDGLFIGEKSSSLVEPPTSIESPCVLASYRDAEGELKFAIAAELSLANSLGAALTMIPPGGAEDATSAGQVPENIAENLNEVFNICSAVFADFCEHRIVLDKVSAPGSEFDDEMIERISKGEQLIQVEYNLARYLPGKLSLIRLA